MEQKSKKLYDDSPEWNIFQSAALLACQADSTCETVSSEYEHELFQFDSEYLSEEGRTYHYAICLAQHVGLKTRLLDWSFRPWVAAFFSCYQFKHIGNDRKADHICVWAYNHQLASDLFDNEDTEEGTFINPYGEYLPDHYSFLHEQKAVLTSMTYANDYYLKHGHWPSLIDYFKAHVNEENLHKKLRKCLIKVTLPSNQANALENLLKIEGIDLARMMPTFNHVADMVQNKK